MIEKTFEPIDIKTDGDDMTGDMRCKACDHYFAVDTNILKPKNAKHDIGTSLTIVCPECKVEGTTFIKDAQVFMLEETIRILKEKLDAYFHDHKMLFKAKSVSQETGSAEVECKRCGAEFVTSPFKNQNAKFEGASREETRKLVITCPLCGTFDESDLRSTLERMQMLMIVSEYNALQKTLAELKGEADAETYEI